LWLPEVVWSAVATNELKNSQTPLAIYSILVDSYSILGGLNVSVNVEIIVIISMPLNRIFNNLRFAENFDILAVKETVKMKTLTAKVPARWLRAALALIVLISAMVSADTMDFASCELIAEKRKNFGIKVC
jgi:hypothetical protein